MSAEHVEVRHGRYVDSVTLMHASKQVSDLDTVESALLAMATPLNVDMLRSLGFSVPEAGPNDLIIAIRAADEDAVVLARAAAESALSRPVPSQGALTGEASPRTVGSAAARSGGHLALISVPGQHAFAEAMDALDAGCDVMLFSDNVPVWQEICLKDVATARGLLVMGPDCGTAVVRGLGLGFANVVEPGPVGLVAASGTGAQQVLCLLNAAGVGVSAALGVGGRDLSAEVGGRATRSALAILDADPATERIVLISKPPAAEVADALEAYTATLATPVEFGLIGPARPDLSQLTAQVLASLGQPVPRWPAWPGNADAPRAGALRGLFAGGTLCDEAMVIAADRLGMIRSNIPLQASWALDESLRADGHLMIDFGDDALTAGRPHPMIDPTLRLQRLPVELADPAVAVVLLDVILGHGAHPDPAADLVPIIATAGDKAVVVSLIGTRADPQGLCEQAAALAGAGAHVFASNADAARFAVSLIEVDDE